MIHAKGTHIWDSDGKLVCNLAKDVFQYELVRLDQFENWRIPVPDELEPLPLAIRDFVSGPPNG